MPVCKAIVIDEDWNFREALASDASSFVSAKCSDSGHDKNLRGRSRHHADYFPPNPEPQVFPDEAEACQGAEAEPSDPSMDSDADREHHQVRRRLPRSASSREAAEVHVSIEASQRS